MGTVQIMVAYAVRERHKLWCRVFPIPYCSSSIHFFRMFRSFFWRTDENVYYTLYMELSPPMANHVPIGAAWHTCATLLTVCDACFCCWCILPRVVGVVRRP